MINRERAYLSLGIEYAEGIEYSAGPVSVPATGREIRRTKAGRWEYQPWSDNYWLETADLLAALRAATPPSWKR